MRKVKIVRAPKFDSESSSCLLGRDCLRRASTDPPFPPLVNKLLELHAGEVSEDTGAKVPKSDFVEPAALTSV